MPSAAPRITARVTPDVQAMLSQAASLSGISSINAFVLNAAIEKAKTILKEESTLTLSRRDAEAFFDALDRPARVHSKLAEAFRRHDHPIR